MSSRNVAVGVKRKKNQTSNRNLTRQQLECLTSLVRVDLYEAIQRRNGASIVELAKDLKRSPHSLYYHVSQLLAVKLIRVREHRRVVKRDEAIYEVVSSRLMIDEQDDSRRYAEALVKTVQNALRKADREHRDARMSSIDSSRFALARFQATLSNEDADKLRAKVSQLNQWIRKRNISHDRYDENNVEEVSITCLVVPIES